MALYLTHPSMKQMPPSTSADEIHLKLLKSRIPRKSLILVKVDDADDDTWPNTQLQCPLRKGIVYYNRHGKILEHNIYSLSKHEPRIVANLHSRDILSFQLVPIKHNRILLVGNYIFDNHLHLSIHEIHSYRLGPALWTYRDKLHSNMSEIRLIKSTTNSLGTTIGMNSSNHMDLFDISTTGDYPLIEAGRLNYNRQLYGYTKLSPDSRILLNADEDDETGNIFYSNAGDANNMDFSFVTHVPMGPKPNDSDLDESAFLPFAFSADGSKFAVATGEGVVLVWDVRNKTPLKIFMVEVLRQGDKWAAWRIAFLQFSSGILGKEVLVFLENQVSTGIQILHLIDATSFETEETLFLPENNELYGGTRTLFFEPSGRGMYVEVGGILYEWDLQKNKGSKCEWWLGEHTG